MRYYLLVNESEQYLVKCEEGEYESMFCFLKNSEMVADKIEWIYSDEFEFKINMHQGHYEEISEEDAKEVLSSIKDKKLEKVLFEKFYDEYSM